MPDNEQLRDLLDLWEEAKERGELLDPETLCADCPELIEPLLERIEALQSMDWLNRINEETDQDISSFQQGEYIGRYRLDHLIGQGGFGEVWAAYDPMLDRLVAIKLPHNNRSAFQDIDAFLIEARRIVKLRHPNIISVHDAGQDEGRCYFVSELIDGADLSEQIASASLSQHDACRIVQEIALAVHHAHRNGFIHRDIKPSNILIDQNGNSYLADFGTALSVSNLESDTVGTLAYMAPELIDDEDNEATVRTDIYALGVVLYQVLTGNLPFPQSSHVELRKAILAENPTFDAESNIPAALQSICLRAMAKNPEERYSFAKELAHDLHRYLNPKRKSLAILGIVLVLLIAGIFARDIWYGEKEVSMPDIQKAVEEGKQSEEHKIFQAEFREMDREVRQSLNEALGSIRGSASSMKSTPVIQPERSDRGEIIVERPEGNIKIDIPSVNVPWTSNGRIDEGTMLSTPLEGNHTESQTISAHSSSIDLSNRELSIADFNRMRDCIALRRLNLSNTSINDANLPMLQMPTLADLNLNHTQITDVGLENLNRTSGLMHLSLADTPITDKGIKAIITLRLRSLDLSGTKITDEGVMLLDSRYGLGGNLQNLNLSYTQITDKCIETLKELNRLKQLNLNKTYISSSGIEELQEALPACVIEHDPLENLPPSAQDISEPLSDPSEAK